MKQRCKIVIPTYGRDWHTLKCLELIKKNPECIFTICVRENEYIKYTEMLSIGKNIEFMMLYHSTDSGTTRAEIIDNLYHQRIFFQNRRNFTKAKIYQYCFMIDDTVSDIVDMLDKEKKLIDIANMMVDRFKYDRLKTKGVAYVIPARWNVNRYKYFGTQLCQAYMFDIQKLHDYHLNFTDTKLCGVEDIYLYTQIAMHRLIVYSDNHIIRIAISACSNKQGGTHDGESYDAKFRRLKSYIREIYHSDCLLLHFTHLKKHIAKHDLLDFADFDTELAYRALILRPKLNQELIKNQFLKSRLDVNLNEDVI